MLENRKAVIWSCKLVDFQDFGNDAGTKALEDALSEYLNHLAVKDFNKLIGILYRIDISEEKAIAALAKQKQTENAGETLAKLIIARQKEKIYYRKLYSK